VRFGRDTAWWLNDNRPGDPTHSAEETLTAWVGAHVAGTLVDVASRPLAPVAPTDDVGESVNQAVASSRIESLEPTDEFFAEAQQLVNGELDDDDLVARSVARHRR
jgi:hypothetical protein